MALTNILGLEVFPGPVLTGELAEREIAFGDIIALIIRLHPFEGSGRSRRADVDGEEDL